MHSHGRPLSCPRFLHEMGLKESKIYFYNGLAMMISFFLARNVIGLCEFPPNAWSSRFPLRRGPGLSCVGTAPREANANSSVFRLAF